MRYYALTVDEVLQVISSRQWQPVRQIDAIHLHHTIAPSRGSFAGVASLEKLATHTSSQKLPQHLTIDASGLVWSGRHWELPPASIGGRNGNTSAGPFSIALVGDFNREPFDGTQRSTAVTVVAELLRRLKLTEHDIVFHRDYDPARECPGTRIDADAFRFDVQAALKNPSPVAAARVAAPFSPEYSAAAALLDDLAQKPGVLREPAAAEPREAIVRETVDALAGEPVSRDTAPERKLDAMSMSELRPHVVNLTQGLLSDSGKFKTRRSHVIEIFNKSLPEYIQQCKTVKRKPRLVVFAHGGLNSEESGLEGALNQLDWWMRDNRIYPLFFVWETGLLQAIRFTLRSQAGTRNIFSDNISDPLIERTVHRIGGVQIWGNMKQSAERASLHPDGGANLVAKELAALMAREPGLEVHAIGHSAGAIFHAHFLEALTRHGAPRDVNTLSLLAPAIRVDEFKSRVMNRVGKGKGIGSMAMFTMRSNLEEDDQCVQIYRKSLLCLIRAGLEPQRNTPILGLEDSIGDDAGLMSFFGLDGSPAKADLIFSLSPKTAPQERRTSSTSHGGFDNNADTMDSVASRILGPVDSAKLVSFVNSAANKRAFVEEADPFQGLPEDIRLFLTSAQVQATAAPSQPTVQVLPQVQPQPVAQAGLGRRRALCVGINDYGSQSLQFCVADAELWARSLQQQGFTTTILRDGEATRDGILNALGALVRDSVAGDMLAVTFAGHGTLVPDVDGDESKTGQDFAYVPFDFESGAFVLDDDIFAIWRELKEGVTATSFFDACHSGNGLRMLARGERAAVARRARFLSLTPEQQRKHLQYRMTRGFGAAETRSAEIRGSVVFFSACAEHEVALEQNGHGDFSRIAAPQIASAAGLTNRGFHARVLEGFGAKPAQTPQWDAAPEGRRAEIGELPILQPVTPRLPIAAAGGRALAMTTLAWRRNDVAPRPVV